VRLTWYTDGSKINKGTEAGKHTTIFQAEVYGIKACTVENLVRDYRNRNICILLDSQAAIKALDNYRINSKLVLDCRQSLLKLAKYSRVQLIWVPSQRGIEGNENADQLAKL
jgi:ribonuclease HI